MKMNMHEILTGGGASLAAWWKNHSFTRTAQAADEYMSAIKEETEK